MKRNRPSPLRMVVAGNMRRLREVRGLSQEALADEAELHRVKHQQDRAGRALTIARQPSLDRQGFRRGGDRAAVGR